MQTVSRIIRNDAKMRIVRQQKLQYIQFYVLIVILLTFCKTREVFILDLDSFVLSFILHIFDEELLKLHSKA